MTKTQKPQRRSFLAETATFALAAAAVLLFFGWMLPMLNVTSFWVFKDTHSVIGGIERFWQEGEWLLLAAHASARWKIRIATVIGMESSAGFDFF